MDYGVERPFDDTSRLVIRHHLLSLLRPDGMAAYWKRRFPIKNLMLQL